MNLRSMCLVALTVGALITQTLGTQFYLGGETPTTGAFLAAGAGDPAPFDGVFIGSDPTGPDFLASWTFSIGVITDPIVSAVLQLGIYDHDSSATGSQVASFLFNGVIVLTSVIDTAFESDPGLASQVKVYNITAGLTEVTPSAITYVKTGDATAPGKISVSPPIGGWLAGNSYAIAVIGGSTGVKGGDGERGRVTCRRRGRDANPAGEGDFFRCRCRTAGGVQKPSQS